MASKDESAMQSNDDVGLVRLRAIAAKQHMDSPSSLIFVVEAEERGVLAAVPNGLIELNEGVGSFVSKEIRNQLAAEFHYSKFTETLTVDSHEWLGSTYSIWLKEGARNDDTVSGRVLGMLNGEVDLLLLAATSIKKSNVFDVLFVVGAALRHMQTFSAEALCKLVRAQEGHTKRDIFRGAFYNKLADEISNRPQLCREILDFVSPKIDEVTHRVYQAALVGLSAEEPSEAAERLIQDWANATIFLRAGVLKAIGSLFQGGRVDSLHKDKLGAILREGLESQDQTVQDSAVEAITIASSLTTDFDFDLEAAARAGSRWAIVSLSLVFSRHWKEGNRQARLEEVLLILVDLLSSGDLNCTYVDDLFAELLGEPSYQPLALSLVDRWVLASEKIDGPSVVDCLRGTFAIILQDSSLLNGLITRWLSHLEVAFPLMLDEVLGHWHAKEIDPKARIRLDLDVIATVEEQLFELSLNSLSSFVLDGSHQVSLVVSLLDLPPTKSERLALVQEVLINDIGYEYPGLVVQELEKILQSGAPTESTLLCQTVIAAIKAETNKRLSLQKKFELEPNTFVKETLRRNSNAKFYRSYKKQEPKSIMRQLATTIPVKGGAQFFTYSAGGAGTPSPMSVIETSQYVPRRMFLDPVGMEMRRLTLIELRRMLK